MYRGSSYRPGICCREAQFERYEIWPVASCPAIELWQIHAKNLSVRDGKHHGDLRAHYGYYRHQLACR